MPANQLFADWVTGDLITASKLNQMKNDLAALGGAIFSGAVTVQPNAGQALTLKGGSSDHVYLGLYARSAAQNTRSGWIGYGSAGTDVLNIANERPGGLVAINDAVLPAERGDINFNSDWNNYTTPGYYRVVAAGSSPANTPPASYTYGALLVIKAGLSLTQLYIQHIGPGTFVRQAWSGSDWSSWVELSSRFIGCRVKRTGDVTINSSSQIINWDAEDFDPQGMHDNTTNPSRIVIPRAGKYLIAARLRWSVYGNPFYRYATIYRNGTPEETIAEINGPGPMDIGSVVKDCAPNDFLELQVSVSGSSATLGALQTHLMVTYLGS